MQITEERITRYEVDRNTTIIVRKDYEGDFFRYYVKDNETEIIVPCGIQATKPTPKEIQEKYDNNFFDGVTDSITEMVCNQEVYDRFEYALRRLLEETARNPEADVTEIARKTDEEAYNEYDLGPVDEVREIEFNRLMAYYRRCDRIRKGE